jgi:hypothetical protein
MVMVEEIQPGWSVWDKDGNEVGTVVAATGPSLRVKRNGGGEVDVPNSAVASVETGRVELSMTKQELDAVRV